MKYITVISCVLLFASIFGCKTIPVQDYSYSIVIKNIGNIELNDVHVFYGNFESVGGVFSPYARSRHSHPGYPLPEKATVQWRTPDGILHKQMVEVKKNVPVNFKGDIQFEINHKNEVAVKFIPESPIKY